MSGLCLADMGTDFYDFLRGQRDNATQDVSADAEAPGPPAGRHERRRAGLYPVSGGISTGWRKDDRAILDVPVD